MVAILPTKEHPCPRLNPRGQAFSFYAEILDLGPRIQVPDRYTIPVN
jgi:hypothetical protein